MPKLSKIRLTGCKYEGLKKQHENSIFDLTRGDIPDHTIFTLENGGGKGVMMQLIFQILLPETKWGKNNGNQVISMFYDTRQRLHPFTFHVVLEWVLDTTPEKRLITGIAMKSSIKNIGDEEDEKASLSYILYTHEYDGHGYYSVENLPLYDEKNKEAIDLKELEEFLYNNRRDFIKYSQSSGRRGDSDYYRYLQSRGIHRNEWQTLRSINKSEGGISDHFNSASDNKAIFQKIILPAVSQNINNYSGEDGNDLIEMFRSNLSITKDLPVLLKRESDYKELLISIEPLIKNADSGSRFIQQKNRIIDEGNDIYYIIKDEIGLIKGEIDKWSLSYNNAIAEKKTLEFKRDNLNYNRERDYYLSKEGERSKCEKKLKEVHMEIEDANRDLLLYRINRILFNKREVENRLDNKLLEKKTLIESLNIRDIEEKAEELDYKLEREWEKQKRLWTNEEIDFAGYLNYSRGLIEEKRKKIKNYQLKKEGLQNQINRFEIQKADFQEEKAKLEESYDKMSLSFPERILEDLKAGRARQEEDRAGRLKEKEKLEETISSLRENISKTDYALGEMGKKAEELREKIQVQEAEELSLAQRVHNLLLKDYGISSLDRKWFNKSIKDMEDLYFQKTKDLEDIQNTLWEKNLQISLNIEDYFIANRDILFLKDEIGNLGIHVETGTEYLSAMDREDKERILAENPGFLYCLVISDEEEWALITRNLDKNIFLNNMVPIYIRSDMGRAFQAGFNTILGNVEELIYRENYILWKASLDEDFNKLSQTKENIHVDLDRISQLKDELIGRVNKGISFEFNKELRDMEGLIVKFQQEQNDFSDQLGIIRNELKTNSIELNKIDKFLETNRQAIEDMEVYIKKMKLIEEEEQFINNIIEELDGINRLISNGEEDIEGIRYKESSLKDSYNKWKFHIGKLIKRMEVYIEGLEINIDRNKDYKKFHMPSLSLETNDLTLILEERENIDRDIAARNSQVIGLDKDIEYLKKEVERHIESLNVLDENWAQYRDLSLPLIEIDIIINEIQKSIEKLQREEGQTRSRLDRLKGEIKQMKSHLQSLEDQILKNHSRAALILEIENIDIEINKVEVNLGSNREFLNLCKSQVDDNEKRSRKLEMSLNRIEYQTELDLSKGKKNKLLREKIQHNIDMVLEEWQERLRTNEGKIKKTLDEGERYRARFVKDIEFKLEEEKLKTKISSIMKDVNINNFRSNRDSFNSMKEHFSLELLKLTRDKEKAEEAMRQWTKRAAIYVIRMIETLKDMVASMNYTNENGYVFPLVKLKNIERLPRDEGEIIHLLEEHFVQSISKALEKNEDIDRLDDKFIGNLVGDGVIFFKALQGRYPILLVYKMTKNNEFKYARPRDEHYVSWEAINKGEGIATEGSGGQVVSVTSFVTMMIMSFKKKHIGNENPSTVLILDNPFGKASGRHVLDPIFEIADKLNFQLICFAAPEIIKVEISERFPIFWELRIEDGKIIHGGRVIKE